MQINRIDHLVLTVASIAALVIVLALLIIFSSDPGDPDDYLFWP